MSKGSTVDLDLTSEEDDDLEERVDKIENYYKQDNTQKMTLAYNWERVHLMLDGQQWLTYKGNKETGGMWEKLEVSDANAYIPRPVTNYLFDAYQTLKGYMLKNDPRITVRPNTETGRDIIAAKIAELVSEANWERLHEDDNTETAASVLLTYGTVFKKDYWDNSYLSLAKVPRMVPEPVQDPNTGQPIPGQTQEVQATDPKTGLPLWDEIPLGDVQTCIVEPYRIALDPLCTALHDPRWIMEYAIRPLSWILENYDKDEPGYTNRASEVTPEKSLSSALKRFYNLKTSSGVKNMSLMSTSFSSGSGGDNEMIEEAAVVKEYYEKPSEKHPKGRLTVVAHGIPLYDGDSPYEGPDQGDWHPYSECRWEILPGRFWGKGALDECCEPQKHINSLDSVIILTRKTTAIPQKLEPKNCITKGNQWTGQPGLRVPYTPGPNGEKPEIIPASGVHDQVFQERAQRVNDIKNLSGAIDILKGDRPPGVTAASALEMLFEVGTGKLHPVMKRWKKMIESSQKKQLRLIGKKYREPRPEFIAMLMAKNKDLARSQIQDFIGTDLYDNFNVVIEASSSIPKLLAAERQKLNELAQLNVLGLEDPSNRAEFLERQGIHGFKSNYGADAARAQWENSVMSEYTLTGQNQDKPVLLLCDNDAIHIALHENEQKKPAYLELPQEAQKMYQAHIEEHYNSQQQKQMQQAMQMAMMGQMGQGGQPPPPPGQSPGPQEPSRVKRGPSIGKQAKSAMSTDLPGPHAGAGDV